MLEGVGLVLSPVIIIAIIAISSPFLVQIKINKEGIFIFILGGWVFLEMRSSQ